MLQISVLDTGKEVTEKTEETNERILFTIVKNPI